MGKLLSPEVVTAVVEELRSIQVDAYRDNPNGDLKKIADWIKDRLSYVVVMLEYGDCG